MSDHWVIKWLQVYIFLSAGMSSKFGFVPAFPFLSGELSGSQWGTVRNVKGYQL